MKYLMKSKSFTESKTYIKTYEFFKVGDIVEINFLQGKNKNKLTYKVNQYILNKTYKYARILDANDDEYNVEFPFDDTNTMIPMLVDKSEIVRKLTDEEVKYIIIEINAKKYNI